ncbi:MAG: J domain-containing protein [Alphaproteobacteria bacterium]
MPWLMAGIVVLGTVLYMAWRAKEAEPTALARNVRIAGIGVLGVATVALALTGRIGLAAMTGMGAAGLWRTVFPTKHKVTDQSADEGEAQNAPRSKSNMARDEALEVLGLDEGASADEIKAAHRRLISQMHPDKGGSDWLAARLNEAKDRLLD